MEREIKVGSLVYDISPYKAPEALYGMGIVINTYGTDYVEVHWVRWSLRSFANRMDLEVVDENR